MQSDDKLMYRSTLCVFPEPAQSVRETAYTVGCVAYLNTLAQRQRNMSCRQLQRLVQEAVRQKNIRLYFYVDGAPAGYLMWGFLTPDVWQRMQQPSPQCLQLHASEWNEGDLPCIIDVLAPRGQLQRYVADFACLHGLDPAAVLGQPQP